MAKNPSDDYASLAEKEIERLRGCCNIPEKANALLQAYAGTLALILRLEEAIKRDQVPLIIHQGIGKRVMSTEHRELQKLRCQLARFAGNLDLVHKPSKKQPSGTSIKKYRMEK